MFNPNQSPNNLMQFSPGGNSSKPKPLPEELLNPTLDLNQTREILTNHFRQPEMSNNAEIINRWQRNNSTPQGPYEDPWAQHDDEPSFFQAAGPDLNKAFLASPQYPNNSFNRLGPSSPFNATMTPGGPRAPSTPYPNMNGTVNLGSAPLNGTMVMGPGPSALNGTMVMGPGAGALNVTGPGQGQPSPMYRGGNLPQATDIRPVIHFDNSRDDPNNISYDSFVGPEYPNWNNKTLRYVPATQSMRERDIREENEKSLTEEERRLPLFPELLNSDGSIGFDISSKIRQIKDRQAKGVPMDDKFVNEIDNYSNEALDEFKQKMAQELPPVLQEKVNEAFDRLSSPENLNKVLDAILPMIFKQGMAEISAYLVADLLTNFLGAELLGTMLPAITRGEVICLKPCHKKNKTQDGCGTCEDSGFNYTKQPVQRKWVNGRPVGENSNASSRSGSRRRRDDDEDDYDD